MRLASYNIEWMNGLFDDGKLKLDDGWSGRRDITRVEQANAIANVLRMIDADLFVILEAPNEYEKLATKRALEKFSRHFGLRQSRARIGFPSGTDQEIALLYDPDYIHVKFRPQSHKNAPRFDQGFHLKINNHRDEYYFSKPPLEAEITDLRSKFTFNLIGAHFKTKAPHGAKNDEHALKIGFENRHKQIAQATWLRRRIDHVHGPLILAGDLNDGPGFDELEKVIGQSSVDILTNGGALYDPALEGAKTLSTARFSSYEDQSYKEALLDFILVNKAMRPFANNWRIWHPLHDPRLEANPKWREALLTASDHFPVSVELGF